VVVDMDIQTVIFDFLRDAGLCCVWRDTATDRKVIHVELSEENMLKRSPSRSPGANMPIGVWNLYGVPYATVDLNYDDSAIVLLWGGGRNKPTESYCLGDPDCLDMLLSELLAGLSVSRLEIYELK